MKEIWEELIHQGLKVALALGEDWRVGEGAEFMDALRAAQEFLEEING